MTTTRGAGTSVSKTSLISRQAAALLFPPVEKTKKEARAAGFGPIEWAEVAIVVTEIIIRVIRRFAEGRDHGLKDHPQGIYVTLVEEILRTLYIDKIGRIGWWERMKMDTSDAFREGLEYGGTVLLQELNQQIAKLSYQPKITLIGHSAGAVYICSFLKAAAVLAPNLRFDVIFEAPAASHALMAATVSANGSQIANFRQFGMSDFREAIDGIVPVIYLSSLLYFVSGLLEQEPDEPLVGMQRYWDNPIYNPASFPNIEICRQFYDRYPNSRLWSKSMAGKGLNTDGHHHGDFGDIDKATMASVEYILQNGFEN